VPPHGSKRDRGQQGRRSLRHHRSPIPVHLPSTRYPMGVSLLDAATQALYTSGVKRGTSVCCARLWPLPGPLARCPGLGLSFM
jgi:hypothetical protein